ncbi:hypothetical protein [Streptomyces sp. NPDC005970]|uniref:hypothetical protein n=1 Tax=Streptomyces sp. NPDC005970 TaxID=3156723 RepID=UPI0033F477C3
MRVLVVTAVPAERDAVLRGAGATATEATEVDDCGSKSCRKIIAKSLRRWLRLV